MEPLPGITCRLQVFDAQFEDGTEKEIYGCSLDDNQSDLGGYTYNIDLSEAFVEANRDCMRKGACFLDLPQAQVLDDEGSVPTIEVPEGTEMIPIDKSESAPQPTQRKLASGSHAVLVVRVRAQSSSCNPSAAELAGSIFGLGQRAITNSMKSQYEACSAGEFSVWPVTGNGVNDGVLDVYMDAEASGADIFSLTNKMFQAASDAVGSSLNASPKHIMYVVPYGTEFNGSKGWVAFAHVSGVNSWYNDDWGNYLSAQGMYSTS
jgi:hypothetical protein